MSPTFAALGVPADVAAALVARGVVEPFPIQSATISAAMSGRDVCGKAPTGCGKTLAFGLPLIERVASARAGHPKGLVLAPTRKLAQQIHDSLRPLLALRGRTSATFYGGVGFGPQLKALRNGVDIAIGCPGRITDLVNREAMILDDVGIVVVDEADRMAHMGFLPDVKRLLDGTRHDRQTLLFSATLDGAVDVLVKRYQRDPLHAEVAQTADEIGGVTHHFLPAERDERLAMTVELVRANGRTIVFSRTKHGADRIARQLTRTGVSAVAIHGGRSQPQRDRALRSFTGGEAEALVATDVAARGLHVDSVTCVVHFDVPPDVKDYVHRSGRTGRAGAEGSVYTLVTDDDLDSVRAIQTAIGQSTGSAAANAPLARRRRPRGRDPRRDHGAGAKATTTAGRPRRTKRS